MVLWPALLPKSAWRRVKLKEGQGCSSGSSQGLGKSYDIFWGTMILSKVKVAQRPSDG